jgi:hypothetical protein
MLTAGLREYQCGDFSLKGKMDSSQSQLRICSFNCRALKSSIKDVISLCNDHDITFLHELWLLPSELSMLSSIHKDFYGYAWYVSSRYYSRCALTGCPYGGTAVLYCKHLAQSIKVVASLESHITCFILSSDHGSVMFVNVYMPTEFNDVDSFESHIDIY